MSLSDNGACNGTRDVSFLDTLSMDDIFHALSSSARLKKRRKLDRPAFALPSTTSSSIASNLLADHKHRTEGSVSENDEETIHEKSRDRSGKRDKSIEKLDQVHREEIAAFRRSMNIRLANKHDPHTPDPIATFNDMSPPSWYSKERHEVQEFTKILQTLVRNIEKGQWKEPTPIQMQAIPSFLDKRDFIGTAPTGSGKSGAFLVPLIILSHLSYSSFYGKVDKQKKHQGEIRAIVVAPSLELASQLHRETERLGLGIPGSGLSTLLLSKSNAPQVLSGQVGGKRGLDILITTPLRLVDLIENGLKLSTVRAIVLDEADRLLDIGDLKKIQNDEIDGEAPVSAKSFLSQMDRIFAEIPLTAVRALFSATMSSGVKELSEAILRNPIDTTIAKPGTDGGANKDIDQKLMFVGQEQGKLLAIRQIYKTGKLRPPVLIFLESQERAQALFGELLYDKMRVDVIHAGRSRSARENAVARFRKGETWILICTDLVARGVDFKAVNMVINYDLPTSGVTYIHRIGRCGRAGRKGEAITLFTEADFDHLRSIANVMKQSGCHVEDWMLQMSGRRSTGPPKRTRETIDTTPNFQRLKRKKRQNKRKNGETHE